MTAKGLRLCLVALGSCLALLQVAGLCLQAADNFDGVIAVTLAQGCAYLSAVYCVLRWRASSRSIAYTILAVAVLLRIGTVAFPPYLSSDIYRYVWDGKVQGEGINPYRYIPSGNALSALRDDAIYPHINRAGYAHTIYPPTAQLIFVAVTSVSATVLAMKSAMVVFDVATIVLLMRFLKELRAPPSHILIYAWHPMAIWEIAGSGHVDAALGTFMIAALLARNRNAPLFSGVFLALAALVKFFPIAIFPAIYRRWDWRLPTAIAATAVCLYAPYLSAGRGVLGFLPSYLAEERLTTGSGFFFINLLSYVTGWVMPTSDYLAIATLLLVGLSLLATRDAVRASSSRYLEWSLWLATAVLLLLSPHYPWYFIWLLPLVCLVPRWSVLVLTAASFILYAALKDRSADRELVFDSLLYGAFSLTGLARLWVRHRQRHSAATEDC